MAPSWVGYHSRKPVRFPRISSNVNQVFIYQRSVLLSLFAMWDYNRLNERNIAICQRDGIDDKHQENYRDVGNDSPLFRYAAVFLW